MGPGRHLQGTHHDLGTRPCGDWQLSCDQQAGRWERWEVRKEGVQHFGDTTPPTQVKAGFQIRTTSSSHPRHTQHLTTDHRPPTTLDHQLPPLSLNLLTFSSSVQIPPSSLDLTQPSQPDPSCIMSSLQIPHRPRPNSDHHGATKAVILVSPSPKSSLASKPGHKQNNWIADNVSVCRLAAHLEAPASDLSPSMSQRFVYNPNKHTHPPL